MYARRLEPAEPAIEAYLAAVAARLIGPRRTRTAILDELRDGLHTAAAAHHAQGMTPDAAVDTALDEFGGPGIVADAFVDELATAQARRTGLAYLLSGPLVGITWLLLLAPPSWWLDGPGALATSIPAFPLIAVGSVAGLLVLAATGRLSRWIHLKSRHLLDTSILLGVACMAGDLVMLATLTYFATPTLETSGPIAAIAATASLTRLACSVTALGRCRLVRSTVAC